VPPPPTRVENSFLEIFRFCKNLFHVKKFLGYRLTPKLCTFLEQAQNLAFLGTNCDLFFQTDQKNTGKSTIVI
jgi:hypothetical protein